MRRSTLLLLAAAWLGVVASSSAETAITVKRVALRQSPAADAAPVANVAANTVVDLVKREGAWVQLKAGSDIGWAKLFDIRMGTSTGAKTGKGGGSSAIADTLNLATGKRDASVTTGVRGLDEAMLQNAQPNEQEVAKLAGYAATPDQAQAFAKSGKLAPRDVAPLDAGATTR
jgi:hypothetical protein